MKIRYCLAEITKCDHHRNHQYEGVVEFEFFIKICLNAISANQFQFLLLSENVFGDRKWQWREKRSDNLMWSINVFYHCFGYVDHFQHHNGAATTSIAPQTCDIIDGAIYVMNIVYIKSNWVYWKQPIERTKESITRLLAMWIWVGERCRNQLIDVHSLICGFSLQISLPNETDAFD